MFATDGRMSNTNSTVNLTDWLTFFHVNQKLTLDTDRLSLLIMTITVYDHFSNDRCTECTLILRLFIYIIQFRLKVETLLVLQSSFVFAPPFSFFCLHIYNIIYIYIYIYHGIETCAVRGLKAKWLWMWVTAVRHDLDLFNCAVLNWSLLVPFGWSAIACKICTFGTNSSVQQAKTPYG